MNDIDWNAALERLENLFETSKSNKEGTDIPDIVKAILEDEADEEFIGLVLMAMEDGFSGSIGISRQSGPEFSHWLGQSESERVVN